MNFELTLYVVLVFLVPGAIALGVIALWYPPAANLLSQLVTGPTAGSGLLVLSASFGLGALVDAVRTVLLSPLAESLAEPKTPERYLAKLNKDTVAVFAFLMERTLEYYRLNANCTVALAVLTLSYVLTGGRNYTATVALACLLALLFVGSVQAKGVSNWAMSQIE